jgi:integrase
MARPRKGRLLLPPHVHCTTARGRHYYTYHPFRGTARAGKRIKLPDAPLLPDGNPNPEWWAAYRLAAGEPAPAARAGTFSALIHAYKASPEWRQLSPRTQTEWARHLDFVEAKWGALLVGGVEPKHVLSLRDMRADTPADANNMLRSLSAMLGWSALRGWRSTNPCLRVPKLKGGEGWAPWPWDAIQHFRAHGPAHLWEAAALALYTGQRQSDVLVMRWSDIDQGLIAVVQSKTSKKLWIPIHKELAALLAVLEARLRGKLGKPGARLDLRQYHEPILLSTRSTAWTRDGFKASWAKEVNEPDMAELRTRRLVFHGLRKSAVVFLLEAGCSDAEAAAITGQSRNIVEHYAKQVNQRRLAAAAILKWEAADAVRVAKTKRKKRAGFVQPRPEFVQRTPASTLNYLKTLERAKGIEPSTLSLGS